MATITPQHDALLFPAVTYCNDDPSLAFSAPKSAGTLDGFRQWVLSADFPERGKITFVNGGFIIDMSPESLEDHSDIKTEISRVLANLVREKKLGWLHVDGVLITNESAGVSNEPDILFMSKQTFRSGRVKLTPEVGRPQSSKEIVGTVDWVLEIVSPSSKKKDNVYLREAYYQAGIEEYWLIDALSGEIDFQLLTRGEQEYVSAKPQDGWSHSPTFDRQFRLEREKDEDGFWLYTLQMNEMTKSE